MPALVYSKEIVQQRIESLPDKMRVAFGLSCCERMLPNYVAFKRDVKWGNEQPLRKALDELWEHIEGKKTSKSTVEHLQKDCEKVTPDADDFSVLLTGPAQEACFAVCCVLDYAMQKNPERIAQVSSFAVDTLDLYVQELESGFLNTPWLVPNSLEREERIRLHPLMQRELARQDADLALLATNPDIGWLKSQWRTPAKSNIDL